MFSVKEELQIYWSKISNKDLICNGCANVAESVVSCKNFEKHKPCSVLYGQCMEYIEKNNIEKEKLNERRKDE